MTNSAAKAFVYRKLSEVAASLTFSDEVLAASPDVSPKTKTSYNKVRNAAAEIAEKLAQKAEKQSTDSETPESVSAEG